MRLYQHTYIFHMRFFTNYVPTLRIILNVFSRISDCCHMHSNHQYIVSILNPQQNNISYIDDYSKCIFCDFGFLEFAFILTIYRLHIEFIANNNVLNILLNVCFAISYFWYLHYYYQYIPFIKILQKLHNHNPHSTWFQMYFLWFRMFAICIHNINKSLLYNIFYKLDNHIKHYFINMFCDFGFLISA